MAKAPQEHRDSLRIWLQFNDEICKINPENSYEWTRLKSDWEDDDQFGPIIKHCEDGGEFSWEYFMDYYERNISYIHTRITLGFDVLVDNVCDPALDYLEFKPEILNSYSKEEVIELMKESFDAGFKKSDIVEAGLEAKEEDIEVNWILEKFESNRKPD